MLNRKLLAQIMDRLPQQPAVAMLGPRQAGKTTLARVVAASTPNALFLDLERDADRAQLVRPELFFPRHRDQLVVLDEVQAIPDLFARRNPSLLLSPTKAFIQNPGSLPGRYMVHERAAGSQTNIGALAATAKAPDGFNRDMQPAFRRNSLQCR